MAPKAAVITVPITYDRNVESAAAYLGRNTVRRYGLTMSFDGEQFSGLWSTIWPDSRPVGHELRKNVDRWVRFHSLPESKRYPENKDEYSEALRRINSVISELVGVSPSSTLHVLTVSWSQSSAPVEREPTLSAALSEADYWTSVLYEVHDDVDPVDERWMHVYVSQRQWSNRSIDPLLRLVADWEAVEVIIADDGLDWLIHPYDGGFDVIAPSSKRRNELRRDHADWLSSHSSGL